MIALFFHSGYTKPISIIIFQKEHISPLNERMQLLWRVRNHQQQIFFTAVFTDAVVNIAMPCLALSI